jgi:L-ascorbate metabolism protein UlaG (beta-lactamase superfamily)
MFRIFNFVMSVCFILFMPLMAEAANRTDITWLGQSGFMVVTPAGRVLFIDPWLTNSAYPKGAELFETLNRADLVLVTHGHGDHVGNATAIAKKTGARLVATQELGRAMINYAGFPEKQFTQETSGNVGGEITLLDGDVKIAFVPALHSSSIEPLDGNPMQKHLMYSGIPGGFVISIKNGPVIYHTGDTDLFSDMALVRDFGLIDIMMLCIGDKFTMGPRRAAQAVKLVEPAIAIPMHYAPTPAWTAAVEAFKQETKKATGKSQVNALQPGETLNWERKPAKKDRRP